MPNPSKKNFKAMLLNRNYFREYNSVDEDGNATHKFDIRRKISDNRVPISDLTDKKFKFSASQKVKIDENLVKHGWLDGKKTNPVAPLCVEEIMASHLMSEDDETNDVVRIGWQVKIE